MASNYDRAHAHNRTVKVLKYVSMNPDRYELITIEKASQEYHDWLLTAPRECLYSGLQLVGREIRITKSFTEWLETEI